MAFDHFVVRDQHRHRPGVVDPQFSWLPVPGAVGYQVEVNASQDFPVGSKWCCDGTNPGTTLSPQGLLANGTYYWRVRAIDVNGDAGVWNVGQPFTESFDLVSPSIQNLALVDIRNGMAQLAPGSPTDTPVITWNPVPGASSYEAQLTPYANGFGCNWSSNAIVQDITTASTAWTPLSGGQHIGPGAWPNPEQRSPIAPGSYCFRLLARRDDGAQNGQIVSDWTQLGGSNSPAFDFLGPPTSTATLQQINASDYLLPQTGVTTPRTPLFTWNEVPGANGYYVVVARDQAFTDVIDIGYTNVPAYAPQAGNSAPYADETTSYYWAVVPAACGLGTVTAICQNGNAPNGSGVNSDPEAGEDAPQYFNKSSTPPTPVSPTGGATVETQPSFAWTSAEGERNYRLQVAADPSFANPLVDITTDSTSYTTTATLPADKTLYWRVRANDTNQGLNWSTISTFTHHLPAPYPTGNPTGGATIPLLTWNAVPGAVSYDLHLDQADGSTKDWSVDSPAATFTSWTGTGIWRWQVRADFPGSNASSAYSTPENQFVRVIPAPPGVSATKNGTRIIISWTPVSYAVQYQVQLSATPGFASPVAADTTDNSAWVPQIQPTTANQTLYWRVAVVDAGGNVGAWHSGVFRVAKPKPKPKPKPRKCIKRRGKRCIKYK